MQEYDGRVRLVIKVYPYHFRDFAHMAAKAALSAWQQGRFRQMHEVMLKYSPRLERHNLIKYAKEAGLDITKFTRDIDGMKHDAHIERDKKLALEMDLYNTPSFFVNGRKVVGNVPYEHFKKVIEEELDAIKK